MVHNGGGTDASGEVTAVDETTMEDGDLEDAVGLLTQLEVLHPPHKLLNAATSTIWHAQPGHARLAPWQRPSCIVDGFSELKCTKSCIVIAARVTCILLSLPRPSGIEAIA